MKVLIVWEEVPESVDLYCVEPTQEEFELLRKASGQYINSSEETNEVETVQEMTSDGGKWADDILTDCYWAEGPFDYVCVCGFFL